MHRFLLNVFVVSCAISVTNRWLLSLATQPSRIDQNQTSTGGKCRVKKHGTHDLQSWMVKDLQIVEGRNPCVLDQNFEVHMIASSGRRFFDTIYAFTSQTSDSFNQFVDSTQGPNEFNDVLSMAILKCPRHKP